MAEVLLLLASELTRHGAALVLAAYLGTGLRIALGEALRSRREGADGPLWQTLAVVTPLWPLLLAQKAVFGLILFWDIAAAIRAERREMRGAEHG